MREPRVEFAGVWKKFRRGERSGTLRDALPALARRWRRRRSGDELGRHEFHSLKDISFNVRGGECVGVIGHNGAGKSTVLKCASRILRPNAGHVRVDGRVSALIEVGAGFHHDLTGRENVYLNGTILGMRRREVADRFDQIVEFSGMGDFIDTPVKRYSSGMYARLGFSVAAFMDPDVLLIDEALSVGDMAFARRCERKIQEIASGHAAVLFVSHDLPAVRQLCDRVLVLHQGQILFDGPVDAGLELYHRLEACHGDLGSDRATIQTRLLDMEGGLAGVARPGQELILEVDVVAREPLAEASVGMLVRRDEDELFAITMEEAGVSPRGLAAGEGLSARFRFAANLLPGSYGLGVSLFGRPLEGGHHGRRLIERRLGQATLTVVGPAQGRGTCHLFADCVDATSFAPTSADARERVVARG